MQTKSISILALFVFSSVAGCSKELPLNDEKLKLYESVAYDLDKDGINDTISIYGVYPILDPDSIRRIDFKLSKFGNYSVSGEWDALPEEPILSFKDNLVNSKYVYINRYIDAGLLVFIFGFEYGCCPSKLDVFKVTEAGVKDYWHEDEFVFQSPIQPAVGKLTQIVGARSLREVFGAPTSEYVDATTYVPTLSFSLGQKLSIDLPASERLTRAELGGFAGTEYREDIVSVKDSDGVKRLWDNKNAKPLD